MLRSLSRLLENFSCCFYCLQLVRLHRLHFCFVFLPLLSVLSRPLSSTRGLKIYKHGKRRLNALNEWISRSWRKHFSLSQQRNKTINTSASINCSTKENCFALHVPHSLMLFFRLHSLLCKNNSVEHSFHVINSTAEHRGKRRWRQKIRSREAGERIEKSTRFWFFVWNRTTNAKKDFCSRRAGKEGWGGKNLNISSRSSLVKSFTWHDWIFMLILTFHLPERVRSRWCLRRLEKPWFLIYIKRQKIQINFEENKLSQVDNELALGLVVCEKTLLLGEQVDHLFEYSSLIIIKAHFSGLAISPQSFFFRFSRFDQVNMKWKKPVNRTFTRFNYINAQFQAPLPRKCFVERLAFQV